MFVSTIFYLVAEKVREGKGREGKETEVFEFGAFKYALFLKMRKVIEDLTVLVRIKGNDFVFENGKRGIGAGNVFVVLGGFKNCF